jgi:hypothetical protein
MADVVQHGPSGSHRAEAVSTSLSAGCVLGWISAGLATSAVGACVVVGTVQYLGPGTLLLYFGLLLAVAIGPYGRGRRQFAYYGMGIVMSIPCLFVALLYAIGHSTW